MNIQILDPLSDPRWETAVACHAQATPFHTRGWIEALSRTYGYKPLVLTTSQPGQELRDAVVFCRVSSWMTGTRLVSLPFADHCQPLLDEERNSGDFMHWLCTECDRRRWKYVEIRPLLPAMDYSRGLEPERSFCFHELDLSPSLENIFRRMHKNCLQRKIRRAEREQLSYECGNSRELVDEFYRLTVATRRRHRLLPQPRKWFRNLAECMPNNLEIRVARKDGMPIAAILTLRHGAGVVYKYGSSLARFHNLGGMPFLFWKLIEESKASRAERIDFGRSDLDTPGLIQFKDRLGTSKRLLTYYRHTYARQHAHSGKWLDIPRILFSMPDAFLATAGRVVYKHLG